MADHTAGSSLRAGSWPSQPVPSTAAAVSALVVLTAAWVVLGRGFSPPVAHGVSHLVVAVPVAALAYAAWRRWPPARATAPGATGRLLIVIGLVSFAVGGVVEMIGARVGQIGVASWERTAHAVGQVITLLALLVLAVGFALAVTAAARDRALPRWSLALVPVALLALGMLVMGAPGSR
jgi:hypothetical protein